jgi:hypothetical protein
MGKTDFWRSHVLVKLVAAAPQQDGEQNGEKKKKL